MQRVEYKSSEWERTFPGMRFTLPHHNREGRFYGDVLRHSGAQQWV